MPRKRLLKGKRRIDTVMDDEFSYALPKILESNKPIYSWPASEKLNVSKKDIFMADSYSFNNCSVNERSFKRHRPSLDSPRHISDSKSLHRKECSHEFRSINISYDNNSANNYMKKPSYQSIAKHLHQHDVKQRACDHSPILSKESNFCRKYNEQGNAPTVQTMNNCQFVQEFPVIEDSLTSMPHPPVPSPPSNSSPRNYNAILMKARSKYGFKDCSPLPLSYHDIIPDVDKPLNFVDASIEHLNMNVNGKNSNGITSHSNSRISSFRNGLISNTLTFSSEPRRLFSSLNNGNEGNQDIDIDDIVSNIDEDASQNNNKAHDLNSRPLSRSEKSLRDMEDRLRLQSVVKGFTTLYRHGQLDRHHGTIVPGCTTCTCESEYQWCRQHVHVPTVNWRKVFESQISGPIPEFSAKGLTEFRLTEDVRVIVVESERFVQMGLDALQRDMQDSYVGIDLEWRPDRARGIFNPVALVQLSAGSTALLIRTSTMNFGWPPALDAFLRRSDIRLVGFSWGASDEMKIQRSFGFSTKTELKEPIIDLQKVAMAMGFGEKMGLANLTKSVICESFHKEKKVSISNWAAPVGQLSAAQIKYGALDALATGQVFRALRLWHHHRRLSQADEAEGPDGFNESVSNGLVKDEGKKTGEIKGAVGGTEKGEGATREGIPVGKEILTTNEIPTSNSVETVSHIPPSKPTPTPILPLPLRKGQKVTTSDLTMASIRKKEVWREILSSSNRKRTEAGKMATAAAVATATAEVAVTGAKK